jgi:hypothetical protein
MMFRMEGGEERESKEGKEKGKKQNKTKEKMKL